MLTEDDLLAPTVAYGIHPLVAVDERGVALPDGTVLAIAPRDHVAAAERLAVGVCSIGTAVDTRAAELLAARRSRLALALDIIANWALARLFDQAWGRLARVARRAGLRLGSPLEPGVDGFALSEQASLLRLANAQALGFFATTTGMVGPGRTVTFAAGMGRNLPVWDPADRCRRCGSRDYCKQAGRLR